MKFERPALLAGKDERGVGYVKRNAIAGRRFARWGAFLAHLDQWNREVADVRVHGTTGELPIVRFADDVADHAQCEGRRQRVIERTHPAGLVGAGPARAPMPPASPPALLRPLAEYEAVVGEAG